MILTNLKVVTRNIYKHKLESLISIAGLGIGLGAIFLLTLLVVHEYSFNQFVPEKKSAYRVLRAENSQNPYLLASTAKAEIPEIQDFFRLYQTNNILIKDKSNQILRERRFALADESIFRLWGVNIKAGIPASNRNQVMLSEEMAAKYLSGKNSVGSVISIKLKDEFLRMEVSGIYEDFPSNSTLHPNFIANIELSDEVMGQTTRLLGQYGNERDKFKNWKSNNYYTYLYLNSGVDPEEVAQKMQVYNKHFDENHQGEFRLQAVEDTYLNSANLTGISFSRIGNPDELKYYMAIALIILLIAIVNYVFLTRAKVMGRFIELGAQKALGATSTSIRKQILLESNLIAFISVLPAIIIVFFGIRFVNTTLGKSLSTEVFANWESWLLLLCIILITGTISGFFISVKVSRIPVVSMLSGGKSTKRNLWDNSFLSFHYAIFIVLIVAVFVFKKQINHSLNNFKSINPENVLICGLNTPELQKKVEVMQNELNNTTGVVRTAGSSFIPPFNYFLPVRLRSEDLNIRFDGLIMGEGMTELLEMELVEGEHFGKFESGHTEIIFNESAAIEYNIKVGEPFSGFKVRGIVKDFTAHSAKRLIEPMAILQQHPDKMRFLVIKTDGSNDKIIREKLTSMVNEFSPDAFVDIRYLSDQINHFYDQEQNQAKIITAFSFLAIVLAIMGLFGIVLNTISKRTKEIGIRKVNGSSTVEILGLLNLSFLKWIVIAFVLACPAAYFAMSKWLENFAYKTTLNRWVFALAGVLAFVIALLTVSFQSYKAATRNPVEALRYE